MSENKVKQVILIRSDLGMRRGKEIAQGSHASIAFMTERLTDSSRVFFSAADFTQAEWEWMQGNFRKICVRVHSEEELLSLVGKAKEAGLTAHAIQDTGLTEFGGVPTWTAAAIGPDTDEKINPITGHLELY